MNKQIAALAVIVALMFGFAAISEVHAMDKKQALSAMQESIISIAAFTTNGDMEKLCGEKKYRIMMV
jgi:4-carboxymuconolactone decarboxylase